ncbi:hypothetical protein [Gallaecimonas xiamenensis]|uniref:DUF1360 domain-containing protein n=1 Tax=Gallaecimonas xiamenensis 3-C-1 TaxID=745411 RepID=K2JMA7_9GAMM|nr:hypothetical protein [Gallaecimonas xiamenensis]EKE71619.1 hypothetical protein B3C1_11809 [Gallaecimonas xiamenensis 3-C-1]
MSDPSSTAILAAFWQCLVVAVAASSISITITQTELFRPWREWTAKKSHMIGYLFKCFYCFSHWVVFAGIAIYRPVLVESGALWVDWTVSAFFTLTLCAFVSGLFFKVFQAAMTKAMVEKDMRIKLGLE